MIGCVGPIRPTMPRRRGGGRGPTVDVVFGFSRRMTGLRRPVNDDRGWHLDRQHGPEALHIMVSPAHAKVADNFLEDLRFAIDHHGDSKGVEARYS